MSSSHFTVHLSFAKWSSPLIQNRENIMYAICLVNFDVITSKEQISAYHLI